MKKMLRIAAALAALLAMTNFIGCKNDDDDGDVAVTEVKITSTVTEVTAGETITLTAEVLPADATNKTVTWTSSDNTVATVKDGVVTGVKAGEATITASAGGKNATVKVTVKAAATSGGETGGETGTTTGFENTYWVLPENITEESGIKITIKNGAYLHITDSTNGSIYISDLSEIEAFMKAGGGTKDFAYPETATLTFTYTVEGSKITVNMDGETFTGIIDDANTLTIEGRGTYKKVDAVPTAATVTVEVTAATSKTYTLEASSITTFIAGNKADGQEEALDDYFTAIWSAKSKVDGSSKSFSDGYSGSQRINFGGKMLKGKNAIKFTTTKAATVKIWWAQGGDDNRQIGIGSATDYSGDTQNTVAVTNETLAKNEACVSTLELSEAGTWILGGITNNNYIFKIEVTE